MKCLSKTALLALVCGICVSGAANADVVRYRVIDEQLTEISSSARELRWDIALAPLRESDRRSWQRNIDDICDEVLDLQKSVLRGRNPEHLCREVDDLREEICEFRDDLVKLGQPSTFRYERGLSGSRFRCGVLSNGCVMPTSLVSRLEALDAQAANLHTLIAGVGRPHLGAVPVTHAHPHQVAPQLPEPPVPYAVPLPGPQSSLHRWPATKRDEVLNTVQWFLSQLD